MAVLWDFQTGENLTSPPLENFRRNEAEPCAVSRLKGEGGEAYLMAVRAGRFCAYVLLKSTAPLQEPLIGLWVGKPQWT